MDLLLLSKRVTFEFAKRTLNYKFTAFINTIWNCRLNNKSNKKYLLYVICSLVMLLK